MRLRALVWISCISAAMAVSPVPAAAATVSQCAAGQPTAASYTWDFKGEANTIFKDVQADAQQALYHADKLQSSAGDPNLDWQIHADQLEYLKGEINDIGTKLCRLKTIRRVVAPWQQLVIDQIATNARLMADNAQDAIMFGDTKPKDLWLAAYQKYLNNLYTEAKGLTRSVGNAVEFAGVSKDTGSSDTLYLEVVICEVEELQGISATDASAGLHMKAKALSVNLSYPVATANYASVKMAGAIVGAGAAHGLATVSFHGTKDLRDSTAWLIATAHSHRQHAGGWPVDSQRIARRFRETAKSPLCGSNQGMQAGCIPRRTISRRLRNAETSARCG